MISQAQVGMRFEATKRGEVGSPFASSISSLYQDEDPHRLVHPLIMEVIQETLLLIMNPARHLKALKISNKNYEIQLAGRREEREDKRLLVSLRSHSAATHRINTWFNR